MTGKGMEYGGSLIRVEATGYGTVYLAEHMLNTKSDTLEGKTVSISGSGNVALHAAEKVIQLGGKVITLSDSSGFIYDKKGISLEKLNYIKKIKNVDRARISGYLIEYPNAEFHEGQKPWSVPCKIALPCATQNEIDVTDAETLLKNGCIAVSEGANMPSTRDAIKLFQDAKILFAPSKAANAGGVAVSGLEMSQNSAHLSWKEEELQHLLHDIMSKIHKECVQYGRVDENYVDYVKGANIAGFIKVADAMLAYGSI